MFKVGETYFTKGGYVARVITDDAVYTIHGKVCPIVALVAVPEHVSLAKQAAYFYSQDGLLSGGGNATYDLVSNEPNAEEAKLIEDILDLTEGGVDRKEEALLNIIRQLRNKK
jgi:hypothetical protein